MKLHLISIQAFGPFANKEVIDFSELGENPLFLIDGPTGAGKSSILHAICYALYGETTDSDRKGLGLRCDHAAHDVLTELSLEFSIRGDRYRITRVPFQMRPAIRGGGETEQKPMAHLCRILDDGTEETLVTKKTTQADEEIVRIVGLTPAQFLQVMVLPQGKFRELLLAKSDERQVILSKLFQTEIYKLIEQLLKDRAGGIEQQNKAFEEKKQEALLDVNVRDIEELENAIITAVGLLAEKQKEKEQASQKKQKAVGQLEAAEALGKLFDSRKNKQIVLENNLLEEEKINSSRSSIKRAEKALLINPKWKSLQDVQSSIKNKEDDVNKATSDVQGAELRVNKALAGMEKANQNVEQRDPLKAKENELKAYQKKLLEFEPLQRASSIANENHQQAVDKKTSLEKEQSELDEVIKGLITQIGSLSDEVKHKSNIVEQKLAAKFRFEQRDHLEQARKNLLELNTAYESTKVGFEQTEVTYHQDEKEANRIEMLWFTNQAAVLAAKLEDNQPCVVCGSLEHPNPADFLSGSSAITQELVDVARHAEALSRDAMTSSQTALNNSLRSVDIKKEEIEKFEKALGDDANKKVSEVEVVYTSLESQLTTIEEQEQQLDTAKQSQIDNENKRELLTQELKKLAELLPRINSEKATANSELNQASKDLPEQYRNTKVLDQAILGTQKMIQGLDARLKEANEEQLKASSHQSSMLSRLQGLKTNLEELLEKKETLSEAWKQALNDSDFTSQKDFESAHLSGEALNRLRKEVREYEDGIRDLKAEIRTLDEQLKGKQPPDLELLNKQLETVTEVFNKAEQAWTQAQQHKSKLEGTQEKIKKLEKQQSDIKKQYEIVGALSKAASGRGNVRVSLERFVLGNLLDSVLSIASQRLYLMSKGQYQLVRQNEENQKKNTTAGLDLAIDDAHTGKTRPVATLSGGESFMASLALALGLSDVVQERSGGIQLDTLFIDEGFGSLDSESLQLAINTLVDLQSTGRTIGIISHVSELKEQMAQRIDVIGSRNGSKIKTVA